ncbi:MAG: DNA mismatch repair endonuclease MutL [Chthoniobacteraceae bacterium]
MSRIHLLSEEVASQVAAGEVVERPASVVKELVENSLDAKATRIEVAIKRGGSSQIVVVDDGIGMDRDDALLCLERNATSKIRTGEDLAQILTLGFRGEALPSIASVARFRLSTRERDALVGTEVLVNGGRIEAVRDGGEAPGTQIEVRSLFYNLPARRKFLRSENTEASHVEHHLHLQAIGHPEVGFVYLQDERLVFQLPPAKTLRDRIRDLCGAQFAEQLVELPELSFDGLKLGGFIGKAGVSRSTRAQQFVFVNGRAVENSTVNFGLREGYHTALMKGQHPVTFLFIDMDPAAVDVNVHPAKREVRFRDPGHLREAIVESVKTALESTRTGWSNAFSATDQEVPKSERAGALPLEKLPENPPPAPRVESVQAEMPIPLAPITHRRDWSALPLQNPAAVPAPKSIETTPTAETPSIQNPKSEIKNFKILGVLGKLYVLMENAEGLVLVDQHAAHERILFEQLRRRMETQDVPTQRLLMPLTITVTPHDADWITRNTETLHKMGIGIEPFGSGTFMIDTLPQFMRTGDPLQLIRNIIEELRETSKTTSKLRLGEDVIAKTVCRAAVKANDYLREPELVRLIQDLLACELPYCCPHGRPTMIQMSYGELEKKFGRKV